MNQDNNNSNNPDSFVAYIKNVFNKIIYELPVESFNNKDEAKEYYAKFNKIKTKFTLLEKLLKHKPELIQNDDLEEMNKLDYYSNVFTFPLYSTVIITAMGIPYYILKNDLKVCKFLSIFLLLSLFGVKYVVNNFKQKKFQIIKKYEFLIDMDELKSMKSEGK